MDKVSYSMIIRFFSGECTAEEREAVIRWVNRSDDNARRFFAWEEMYLLGRADSREEARLIRKAEKRLERITGEEKNRARHTLRLWRNVRYAAAAVVVAAVAGAALHYYTGDMPRQWLTVATEAGETKELTLPDGSRVWLNENSSLSYPEAFDEGARALKMTGEAYFEVTKDRRRPFTVSNRTMSVRVVGTKFNFRDASPQRLAEASLIEGEIRVTGNNDEGSITLKPGQKVELNTVTRNMKVSEANTALDAVWHDNLIPFRQADIFDIAETLETLYGVEIILSPDIDGTETYSGVLNRKESITEMLDILRATLHISYEMRQNTIFLSSDK